MELVLAVLFLVVIGFFIYADRQDRRIKEEREAHRQEVQSLLNRIQAPDLAAYQPKTQESTGVHHLPFDDDQAWNQWLKEMKTD